jgi:hypothetical protein
MPYLLKMNWSLELMPQNFLHQSLVTLLFSLLISCGPNQESGNESPVKPNRETHEQIESNSARFISKDRKKEEILADYEKPLVSFPAISSDESNIGDDGLVYREGIESPFTGRIIDRFEGGEVKMDSSYLNGHPHGIQVRYFDNGKPALEASFDKGRLSGIKSRWWQNGLIREEEYWSEGKYRGRRLWDESGRLTKEEILP